MAHCFEERDFTFVLTETTHEMKKAFDVPERHGDYACMDSTREQVNTTTHRCFIYCVCWNLVPDSPYLLMEVRDMLADDGMLYDDVCLGTKATTQRSDTCEHSQDTFLLKASPRKGTGDLSFFFLSKSRLRHKYDSWAKLPYLLRKPSHHIICSPQMSCYLL